MQIFVARFASKDPQTQSAMQIFVARFASKDTRIGATTDAKQDKISALVRFASVPPRMRGVLRRWLRMSAKNKYRHSPQVLGVSPSLNLQTEVSILL